MRILVDCHRAAGPDRDALALAAPLARTYEADVVRGGRRRIARPKAWIAFGSHGFGRFLRLAGWSVTSSVMRDAPWPVIVVPPR